MKVYLGSDHRGFTLKEKVAKWLFEWEIEYSDMGADHLDPKDDYTKFASQVATLVANDGSSFGILLCGSGVGVDIVANKFDGVRASIGKNKDQVMAGREDDDMNVLVIAADYTSESEAEEMVKVFLNTKYKDLPRHKRRLEDIKKIEENN